MRSYRWGWDKSECLCGQIFCRLILNRTLYLFYTPICCIQQQSPLSVTLGNGNRSRPEIGLFEICLIDDGSRYEHRPRQTDDPART